MIAADGLVVNKADVIVSRSCNKLRRLKDGRLAGYVGDQSHGIKLLNWIENGGEFPKPCEASALVIGGSDLIVVYAGDPTPMPQTEPAAAIGSGAEHALTALDLGKDPFEAVKAAALRDPFTGGVFSFLALP